MYTGFNLSLCDKNFFMDGTYYENGLKNYKDVNKSVLSNLEEIMNEGIIDGDTLQNMWFPDEIFYNKNFVFISHSHNDEQTAIRLAGYLSTKFGISSFVDSCVWGYMDNLNKQLNDCSVQKHERCHGCDCIDFSYNLSYVHMMLASALITMIDKCECMFFLNTPSSINLNNKTESPWIYYELNIASTIQKISKIKKSVMGSKLYFSREMEFTPDLEQMTKINERVLKEWEIKCKSSDVNPFEILYGICGGLDIERTAKH